MLKVANLLSRSEVVQHFDYFEEKANSHLHEGNDG